MVELKIKLDEGATMPFKANPTDSGYDLKAHSIRFDEEYGFLEYGTGVYLNIPEGYEVLLYPRSSISKYELVQCNSVGIIDTSYSKELLIRYRVLLSYDGAYLENNKLVCWNEDNEGVHKFSPLMYKIGDKIGQMIMQKKLNYSLVQVENIQENERQGFGSTGH